MANGADVEGAPTLPADPDAEPALRTVAPGDGPPITEWDRYELGELLGRGGMGVVYAARDRRLDRQVAIKFIRGGDPNLTLRFLREARAQARIDHPNVCRVYEVGEVAGRAYIAIQRIDGEPLGRVAARMTLDEKVRVLRDVALAIHEAHRLGIIHRDLKPGNVLVERGEDGSWLPIVMDFGLARETTLEVGLTESGQLLGTPAYMSPEQARGDIQAIDRRADVYSLGATLYELLTGRPPFAEANLAIALAQVMHDDPQPPRAVVASVPVDLETIALKCLNKDPGQRYASARALAEDLSRYLDGESIVGRRPTLWQRVRASARRHRGLYVLGAWSTVIIVVLVALGLRSWLAARSERARSRERAALAERLGHDAEEIEWLLRAAYQLPLHDVRGERDAIRARMQAMAATPHGLGRLGDAVVHDALGRGHLALHEWSEAADELAQAAAAGLDTPELHAARGRALGELYHRALDDARRSGDKAWLETKQHELAQKYLAPALDELAKASPAGGDAALLGALVALYQGDYATAETRAEAAADAAPWLFEARKLAADAAYAAAAADVDHGKYDAARPDLERATALYARAADIARSDASVYEAAAQAWLELADIDDRQNQPAAPPLTEALAMIDHALAADPDAATAYTTKAYVLTLCSHKRVDGDGDQRPLLGQVVDAAEHAVTLDAKAAGAWDALGNAHISLGIYEQYHGGDGDPWWSKAVDAFGRALAIRPDDPWANNDLGTAYQWIAASDEERGRDPVPEYQAALASYEHATAVDPAYVFAWSNQTELHASIAVYQSERAIDPSAAVEDAVRTGERGVAIDPGFDLPLGAMAEAELALVRYQVDTGVDPGAALTATRGYLDREDAARPSSMTTWYYRAMAARFEAKYSVVAGKPATASLATARAAIAEALRLSPSVPAAWRERAELELVAAEATADRADLIAARADADKAIALDGHDAKAKRVAAEACLALAKRTNDRAIADAGLAYIDAALALSPSLPRAKAVRDQLAARR